MTSTSRSVTGVVRGRVQGVAFRASMAAQARRLELAGWVRNCADGTVEFAAAGPASAVDALLEWARSGPPLARVDELDFRAANEPLAPPPFIVRDDR